MIVAFNYNHGDFKQLSILIEKPWIKLVNVYNVRDLLPNREEWEMWLKTYNKNTGELIPEFYRMTEFYEDIIRRAGRERRYINLRTKPTIPQYKYVSFNTLVSSLDFGNIEIIDKNAMEGVRSRLKIAKPSPIQEEQLKAAGSNIEGRLFDYIMGRLDQDPFTLHPKHPYWFGGVDNLITMFSYHVTYSTFGTIL